MATPPTSVFLDLTREFNRGRPRAIVCSGQAVVLHRLAIASKDGDWILCEDQEALDFVLAVLERHGARYRFGAPLDLRWLRGGFSSHFEFAAGALRVRTDFFTRPPRVSADDLRAAWGAAAAEEAPFIGVVPLAEMKKTNREKDYVIIGELARLMASAEEQLLYSRSARDLLALAEAQPDLVRRLAPRRPLLSRIVGAAEDAVGADLDAERRALIRANEQRLARFAEAATRWRERWPAVEAATANRPLREAHAVVVAAAVGVLPFSVGAESSDDRTA